MIEEILNHLLVLGGAIGLLGVAYFAWLVSGVGNMAVKNTLKNWSWKRFGKDLLKVVCFTVSMGACSVVTDGLGYYVDKLEIEQLSAFADVVSWGVVIVIPIIAGYYLLYRALKNNKSLVNYDEATKLIGVDDSVRANNDGQEIATSIKNLIGAFVKQDGSKAITVEEPELGANPYYKVDVSTPTTFYNAVDGEGFNEGWGYQCVAGFKEFMYSLSGQYVSAGGAAKNYAMAQSKVEPLGFTWHDGTSGIQNGDWAIWNTGTYGHVSMYYNGQFFGQNQGASNPNYGTPFNLMTLSMNGIVGFYRPNIYNTPVPTPTPVEDNKVYYTYKKGDTFGQVIKDLGLQTTNGLWGENGDVAYYTNQLHSTQPDVFYKNGNIKVGATFYLIPR